MMLRIKIVPSQTTPRRRLPASIWDARAQGGADPLDGLPLSPSRPPAASAEAVRIALGLREAPQAGTGGRMLLFLPAVPGVATACAVADALCGLQQLGEGPILVMDLRSPADEHRTPTWLLTLPPDRAAGDRLRDGDEAPAVISRPFADCRDRLAWSASTEFIDHIADARARFPFVLAIGSDVSTSLESLVVAPLADGVVLALPPTPATRPQLQAVTAQLRRTHAHLLGFVVEAGTTHAHQGARLSARTQRSG